MNTIRVASTLMYGRETAELAEDSAVLRDVRDTFEALQKKVEVARHLVSSNRGVSMLAELDELLSAAKHDACLQSTTEEAIEAERLVGVRVMMVRR
jgi:hypothetical protein